MKRRDFIKSLAASLVLFQPTSFASELLSSNNKIPQNSLSTDKKIIWVVLRGAMDSLHTVVPTFDKNLPLLRPKLFSSIKDNLLMLDNRYGLHPSLQSMHQWYKNKELMPIVAVSSGYKKRSHFDGQDFLESGLKAINFDSGWLGRAVDIKAKSALALANSMPISLRSSKLAKTWYPSRLKDADDDIYNSLLKMYQNDKVLQQRLTEGVSVQEMAGSMGNSTKRKGKFIELSKACAKLMSGKNGVDCAMLELGGWDTHNNQASRLKRQLSELDHGLTALKTGLHDQWQNTVVIVATEFGRTAKENGTGGTDHGTASAMFLAGGAIKGGKVLGNWPGLKNQQLFEQRDLMPTTNTFSWLASLLAQHWSFNDEQLSVVFPQVKKQKIILV